MYVVGMCYIKVGKNALFMCLFNFIYPWQTLVPTLCTYIYMHSAEKNYKGNAKL